MKITAHMLDGQVHIWDNVANVYIMSATWVRVTLRGDPWDTLIPWGEREFGTGILFQIDKMEYWEQDFDELDEEDEKPKNWLENQARGGPPSGERA